MPRVPKARASATEAARLHSWPTSQLIVRKEIRSARRAVCVVRVARSGELRIRLPAGLHTTPPFPCAAAAASAAARVCPHGFRWWAAALGGTADAARRRARSGAERPMGPTSCRSDPLALHACIPASLHACVSACMPSCMHAHVDLPAGLNDCPRCCLRPRQRLTAG
eukprot:362534-Chlamydomonas_euryale.AAC.4